MGEKHTLSCLVENHFGVLARVSGLISARGFNIDALTVSATEDPTASRMTIVVDADAQKLEQVKRQLYRLVDVIEVTELAEDEMIEREILLARVGIDGTNAQTLERLAEQHGARVTARGRNWLVVEALGESRTIDALVEALRPHRIRQLVRTGRIAMPREPGGGDVVVS